MGELTVNLALESNKNLKIAYTSETCAEEVCSTICKTLKIKPLSMYLFALRITGEEICLMPSSKVEEIQKNKRKEVDFRIRYKMMDFEKLNKNDSQAFKYLFAQMHRDVMENKVGPISPDHLSGLAVMHMYTYIREKNIPKETVLKDYKRFLPAPILKKQSILSIPFNHLKRKFNNLLEKMAQNNVDPGMVKSYYVNHLLQIAPDYLIEIYSAKMMLNLDDSDKRIPARVFVKVCPKDGLQYNTSKQNEKWESMCYVSDICAITTISTPSTKDDAKGERSVIIHHRNGVPFTIWFSEKDVYSVVSLIDGYFRLSVDWTMNICADVLTPSLQKLKKMNCYGPVGAQYSYSKIRIKMEEDNKKQYYLIRMSEDDHDVYYIDVFMKENKSFKAQKIQKLSDNHYIFEPDKDASKYDSIIHIVKCYSDANNKKEFFLQECIGYPACPEVSQILLCRNDSIVGNVLDLSEQAKLPSGPVCIYKEHLQIIQGTRKLGSRGYTSVYKGNWRYTPGKRIQVAIKKLERSDENNYLKEYLQLLGHWAFLENPAIVKLHGIFLTNSDSVWQYCQHGSLDEYLRNNRNNPDVVDQADLINAAKDMASAIFYLHREKQLVHGKIRCRKILVHSTEYNKFIVRLADPGIRTDYRASEIHWLPVECYATQQSMRTHIANQEYVRKAVEADIWALATTYYEIFSWGEKLDSITHPREVNELMKWYCRGERLKRPTDCPPEIYKLMIECWHQDAAKRKRINELFRDVNNYCATNPPPKKTVYEKIGEDIGIEQSADIRGIENYCNEAADIISIDNDQRRLVSESDYDGGECDASELESMLGRFNSNATSLTTLSVADAIPQSYELGSDYTCSQGIRIGSGNFAEVYKGLLEPHIPDNTKKAEVVALKKLKPTGLSNMNIRDFVNEIHILKNLNHNNIIQIKGIIGDHPNFMLVMEYVDKGSLDRYLSAYKDQLGLSDLLKFAWDIASGMEYLGSRNPAIVHRDLATRNVLVKERDHVKISDFGLAQVTSGDYYFMNTSTRELPYKWFAIESLKFGKYSTRSDVWSYGVTLWEIFQYGETPNLIDPGENERKEIDLFLQALEDGKRLLEPRAPWPKHIYVELMVPCWHADPRKRPTFTQLKKKVEELQGNFGGPSTSH